MKRKMINMKDNLRDVKERLNLVTPTGVPEAG